MWNHLTTPYHPQSNGIDERLNGTLVRILKSYTDEYQENWDDSLKWALYVYNTTVHESTGYSPYQVLHGMNPRSPLSVASATDIENLDDIKKIREMIRNKACELNAQAQSRQAVNYNLHHSQPSLQIGDLVLAREQTPAAQLSKKLHARWYGPCVVIGFTGDKDNPKAVVILDSVTLERKTVSIRDVKPYHERSTLYQDKSNEIQKQKGGDRSQDDLYDASYYSTDSPLIDLDESNAERRQSNIPFDLSILETNKPVSSSPRRVTISGQTETRYFCPESAITEEPSNESTIIAENATESTREASERRTDQQLEDPLQNCPEKDRNPTNPNYVMDFIIDDSTTDPTFKAPIDSIKQPERLLRSQGTAPDIVRSFPQPKKVRTKIVHTPVRDYPLRSRKGISNNSEQTDSSNICSSDKPDVPTDSRTDVRDRDPDEPSVRNDPSDLVSADNVLIRDDNNTLESEELKDNTIHGDQAMDITTQNSDTTLVDTFYDTQETQLVEID